MDSLHGEHLEEGSTLDVELHRRQVRVSWVLLLHRLTHAWNRAQRKNGPKVQVWLRTVRPCQSTEKVAS
jgi:hypothetical protein